MSHTPPPRYTLAKSKKNGSRHVMLDMTGATVAVFQNGFHTKDFESIVRACNSHAGLVAALDGLLRAVRDAGKEGTAGDLARAEETARAELAKAKGGAL
jgi:hypothetical protein